MKELPVAIGAMLPNDEAGLAGVLVTIRVTVPQARKLLRCARFFGRTPEAGAFWVLAEVVERTLREAGVSLEGLEEPPAAGELPEAV